MASLPPQGRGKVCVDSNLYRPAYGTTLGLLLFGYEFFIGFVAPQVWDCEI